jgi:hypothetical protein
MCSEFETERNVPTADVDFATSSKMFVHKHRQAVWQINRSDCTLDASCDGLYFFCRGKVEASPALAKGTSYSFAVDAHIAPNARHRISSSRLTKENTFHHLFHHYISLARGFFHGVYGRFVWQKPILDAVRIKELGDVGSM